jgi:hypothetical protein
MRKRLKGADQTLNKKVQMLKMRIMMKNHSPTKIMMIKKMHPL